MVVDRKMPSPHDVHILITEPCEHVMFHGKGELRVPVDEGCSSAVLEMGRLPWIIQVAQWNHKAL